MGLHKLFIFPRISDCCARSIFVALSTQKEAHIGTAEPGRSLHDGLKNWVKIKCRAADDLQDVTGRSLIFEGLARFSDEPRVLHGDNCLRGEALDQRDLLFGKRANFLSEEPKNAYNSTVLNERHAQGRASTTKLDDSPGVRFMGFIEARCRDIAELHMTVVLSDTSKATAGAN